MIETPPRRMAEPEPVTRTPAYRPIAGALSAVAGPVVLGVVFRWLFETAYSVEGAGPFFLAVGGYVAVGAVATRIGGYRTLLFGLVASMGLIFATLTDDSFGAVIPVVALLAGATLARRTIGVTDRIPLNRALAALLAGVLATAGLLAATHVNAEEAALIAAGGGTILASTETPYGERLFLLDADGPDRFVIVTVVRGPAGWWRAADAGGDVAFPRPSWGRRIVLPHGCVVQARRAGFNEAVSLCLVDGSRRILAGVAPATAVTVERHNADGTIQVTPLRRGSRHGYLFFKFRGFEIQRLVFRDADGRLLDSRIFPPQYGSLFDDVAALAVGCDRVEVECVQTEFDDLTVSVSALDPADFERFCSVAPPGPGTVFVASVAGVDLPGANGMPYQREVDRRLIPNPTIVHMAVSRSPSGYLVTHLPSTPEPCFPPAASRYE